MKNKNNFIYMLKNWIKWDKKSLVYFIVRVPALVLQPIITALIPKAMIDCINENASVERLIITVAQLSFLVALTTWLAPFMQELLNGSSRIIRMRYAVMAFDKNLNTDYVNTESTNAREMNSLAGEFYKSYYSGSAAYIEILNSIFVCIAGIITSLVLIYKVDFYIIILILATCVGEFFVLQYLNKQEYKVICKESGLHSKFDYFYEQSKNFAAAKDIRIYNFSDRFIMIIANIVYECEKLVSLYTKQAVAVSGTRAFLNLIRELVAYAYLTYLVVSSKISISDFIFYFGIITGFSNWIVNLVYCVSNMQRCCKNCGNFREFIEKADSSDHVDSKSTAPVQVNSIEFNNVSFTYPEAECPTIKGLNFSVKKGENIAVVGENGAGKTTIVKLLCGLYSPGDGNILINGKDNKEYSQKDYFGLFSAVFQDYSFLPLTIAQNVAASSDYDKNKLYQAFDKAGIAEKINSLEKREESLMVKDVFKNAVDFSGGEKQKLLLAKAIYKNAPVLILDEPTAALDPIAENELYLKYNELTKNKISFFISHRLSSTRFCDRIFFISDGKITEQGTHDELMQMKGKYYRMYRLQSYYYQEQGVRYE